MVEREQPTPLHVSGQTIEEHVKNLQHEVFFDGHISHLQNHSIQENSENRFLGMMKPLVYSYLAEALGYSLGALLITDALVSDYPPFLAIRLGFEGATSVIGGIAVHLSRGGYRK